MSAKHNRFLLATPTEKSRGCPLTRWCDYISDLAWFHLGVEPAELSQFAQDFLGLLPLQPSEEKGYENE